MKIQLGGMSFVGVLILATSARAQTAVQLPSFGFTTVNTTVSVPDQGSALLGGISRSSEGSVSRGVPLLNKVPFVNRAFNNRAIGRDTSANQMRVHATIISLNELDEAVLAEAAARRSARGETVGGERFAGGGFGGAAFGGRVALDPALDARANFLSRHVGRAPLEQPAQERERQAPSPEEIRRQTETAKEQRDAESVAYFEKAEAAVADGKSGVAKIYYSMAAKRATGEFKAQVFARLEALNGGGVVAPTLEKR